jgi:hypothetical protein
MNRRKLLEPQETRASEHFGSSRPKRPRNLNSISNFNWMLDDSYANCGSNCCGRQIPSQKNSKIARIVGTGYQKHDQLFALNEILSVYEVRVNDVSKDRIEKYVVEMSKKVSPRIRAKPNLAELLKENARAHNRVRYKR